MVINRKISNLTPKSTSNFNKSAATVAQHNNLEKNENNFPRLIYATQASHQHQWNSNFSKPPPPIQPRDSASSSQLFSIEEMTKI